MPRQVCQRYVKSGYCPFGNSCADAHPEKKNIYGQALARDGIPANPFPTASVSLGGLVDPGRQPGFGNAVDPSQNDPFGQRKAQFYANAQAGLNALQASRANQTTASYFGGTSSWSNPFPQQGDRNDVSCFAVDPANRPVIPFGGTLPAPTAVNQPPSQFARYGVLNQNTLGVSAVHGQIQNSYGQGMAQAFDPYTGRPVAQQMGNNYNNVQTAGGGLNPFANRMGGTPAVFGSISSSFGVPQVPMQTFPNQTANYQHSSMRDYQLGPGPSQAVFGSVSAASPFTTGLGGPNVPMSNDPWAALNAAAQQSFQTQPPSAMDNAQDTSMESPGPEIQPPAAVQQNAATQAATNAPVTGIAAPVAPTAPVTGIAAPVAPTAPATGTAAPVVNPPSVQTGPTPVPPVVASTPQPSVRPTESTVTQPPAPNPPATAATLGVATAPVAAIPAPLPTPTGPAENAPAAPVPVANATAVPQPAAVAPVVQASMPIGATGGAEPAPVAAPAATSAEATGNVAVNEDRSPHGGSVASPIAPDMIKGKPITELTISELLSLEVSLPDSSNREWCARALNESVFKMGSIPEIAI